MDTSAVQRHRNIILDCLRDGDISIRRRALELSYALINEQNVRILVRELLAFLEVADDEFKTGMTTQISLAAERFAPNKRWHIDTVLRSLKLVSTIALKPDPKYRHLLGRKLCQRRDTVSVHPSRRTYPRVASLYRIQVVHCSPSRPLAGIPHTCRSLDHW